MFEQLVVPVDLTDRNRDVVDTAEKLIASGGRICLLHVIESIPGLGMDEDSEFYDKLERKASEFLAELGEPLAARGVGWTAEVIHGSRARTILEESRKLGADLIVMRSHRVDAEQAGQGFSTLSYQIGILAECSVLLVK